MADKTKRQQKEMPTKTASSQTESHDARKANSFLRYLSILLVVVFTSFSIITLTTRWRLLTPQVYNEAIAQSGIYELSTEVVEEKATDALIALEKQIIISLGLEENSTDRSFLENAIVWALTNTLDDATATLVSKVSERIDLTGIFRSATETLIANDIAWLRGETEAPEIFQLIPEPEAIMEFRSGIEDQIEKPRSVSKSLERITNLPICGSSTESSSNLVFAKQGNLASITCTSEEITLAVTTSVANIAQSEMLWGEGGLGAELDNLGLTSAVDAIYETSLAIANLKQDALAFRNAVARSRETAMFFLSVSLPLLAYALIVSKGKRVRTLLRTYLATGLVICVFAIIEYLILTNALAHFVGDATITSEGFLSATQQIRLAQSIRSIELYIVRDVSYFLLLAGVSLVALTATPLAVFKFMDRRLHPSASKN